MNKERATSLVGYIDHIDNASDPASVTNEQVAFILRSLYEMFKEEVTKADQATKTATDTLNALNKLTSQDLSDEIENVQEVLNFLKGMKDDEKLQSKLSEILIAVASKVDKVDGKGLSTNDYTDTERTKLQGVEAGANKYVHPDKHPASIITEDATHRFMTDTERTKLQGVEAGANKYVHPDKHPASIIEQSDDRMFVSKEFLESAERIVDNGIELLPISMSDYYTLPPAPQQPDKGIFLVKGDPYDFFLLNKYGSIYKESDYNRTVTYMGMDMLQARTDRLYICSGRLYTYDGSGLVAIATSKDASTGSGSGDGTQVPVKATDVQTDAQHRFASDAEKKKWNTPELLPIDGFCESRTAMPTYGIWAFPDESGQWTIDGDFSGLGLLRTDYCDRMGIDLNMFLPKQTVLFLCKCNESKCRRLYYSDAENNYEIKPYARFGDIPSTDKMVPVLPVDAVANSYDAAPMAESDDVVLEQMSIGVPTKWIIRGDVTKYGSVEDYGTVNAQLSNIQNQTIIDPKAGLLIFDRTGKELYRTEAVDESVATGGVTVKRYVSVDATLDRMPKLIAINIVDANKESDASIFNIKCSAEFTESIFRSIRVGDVLSFTIADGVDQNNVPNGLRGRILVTNTWDDEDIWSIGFYVWGLDFANVGKIWWQDSLTPACANVQVYSIGSW